MKFLFKNINYGAIFRRVWQSNVTKWKDLTINIPNPPQKLIEDLNEGFSYQYNFISEIESQFVLNAVEVDLREKTYITNHFDQVAVDFKEYEKTKWPKDCMPILAKLKRSSFRPGEKIVPRVHVLDISESGYFLLIQTAGDKICALNLGSPCILRLKQLVGGGAIDFLIKPRSYFTFSKNLRKQYTHEILSNEESFFDGVKINKQRFIAVIIRSTPETI